ncbi:hypothetical protein HPG69_018591 [Diceros bicornis minor]|uniref:Uncharacterized protein n=1 Tax=Diceros bicornis minor TaxID=77932 RepID=A0A7J7EZR8_DICBM|nr:hypothetical protein HPG69_018591 [Diceros bicornis minor]
MGKQQQGGCFAGVRSPGGNSPRTYKITRGAPSQGSTLMQPPSYFSQHCNPQWLPFSTTYGACYKPWKMEPETYHGEKPLHSGDQYLTTTHQISFQNPPLGQLLFPVHTLGRKVAPTVHPGYMECISQYQSDFQAPGWSPVLEPDPARNSQEIK